MRNFFIGLGVGIGISALALAIVIMLIVGDWVKEVDLAIFNVSQSIAQIDQRTATLGVAYVNLVTGINELDEKHEQRVKNMMEFFIEETNGK